MRVIFPCNKKIHGNFNVEVTPATLKYGIESYGNNYDTFFRETRSLVTRETLFHYLFERDNSRKAEMENIRFVCPVCLEKHPQEDLIFVMECYDCETSVEESEIQFINGEAICSNCAERRTEI